MTTSTKYGYIEGMEGGGPAMLKGSGENTAKLDLLSHMSGLRAVLTSCTHLLDNASPGEAGRPAGAPDTD